MCNSKTIQICSNQYADILRFLFIDDIWKIEKGLELVSRQHFSNNFLIKAIITLTIQIFTSVKSYLVKCVSCFMLRHLMTSWHLNIWKLKIWLSQELKELSKWNKKHFSWLHKCSHLDLKQASKNVVDKTFTMTDLFIAHANK